MKKNIRFYWRAARNRLIALLFISPCVSLISTEPFEGPEWWAEQNVLSFNATADDYAVINQGQLKTIATKAYYALIEKIGEQNATAALSGMIAAWRMPSNVTDDYIAVNIGQAKYVSSLFYNQLGLPYPWGNGTVLPDNYALANAGQIKNLFSFELSREIINSIIDTDGNGLPDAWELQYFGTIGVDVNADPDGDGLSNWMEYILGTNPTQQTDPELDSSSTSLRVYTPSAW